VTGSQVFACAGNRADLVALPPAPSHFNAVYPLSRRLQTSHLTGLGVKSLAVAEVCGSSLANKRYGPRQIDHTEPRSAVPVGVQ
jgi:hypothetical protein